MKLLTFNIAGFGYFGYFGYFDYFGYFGYFGDMQRKVDDLGEIVLSRRPEFIALQNVSHITIRRIMGSTWATHLKCYAPGQEYEARPKPINALLGLNHTDGDDFCSRDFFVDDDYSLLMMIIRLTLVALLSMAFQLIFHYWTT